jgi:hypothetical protein
MVISEQPTPLDRHAAFVFHSNVTQVLPGLALLCRQLASSAPAEGSAIGT